MNQNLYQVNLILTLLFVVFTSCETDKGIEGNNNDGNQVVVGDNNTNFFGENYQNVSFKKFILDKIYTNSTLSNGLEVYIEYLEPIEYKDEESLQKLRELIANSVFYEPKNIGDSDFMLEMIGGSYFEGHIENLKFESRNYSLKFTVEIVYNDKDVLVLKKGGYTNFGGAHENPIGVYYNIDLQSMKMLDFDDVFMKNSERGLARIITNCLKEFSGADESANLSELEYWKDNVDPVTEFYITNTGICFVYPEYMITSFADGRRNVCIPFEDLQLFINDTFPLKRLL